MNFSLIINGNVEGFFQSQRGLGQGDPMSPFLFLIAMEGLNHMFRKAKTNGWGEVLVHRQGEGRNWRDHTLILCWWCSYILWGRGDEYIHLRAILSIFQGISGLHVIWLKSHLFPINNVDNMFGLAEALGSLVDALPTKYLGTAFGSKKQRARSVKCGVEETWETRQHLPTYMMNLCQSPRTLRRKLRLRRTFLCQDNKEIGGYNLVKWDTLTLNRIRGRLGLKNLNLENSCLLEKWLWKFCTEDSALWRRFIAGKYGLFNQWTTEEVFGHLWMQCLDDH